MRAGAYEEHECVLTLTASEERAAAGLLKRAISTSSKGIIQLASDIHVHYKPSQFNHSRMFKNPQVTELPAIRRVVSGGQPSVLFQNEVLSLGDEQRRALLKEAGISDEIKIGPAEVIAIKVGLAIPWNKIRILRRWLKASKISLACGEEFRGAPFVFIPDLILKVESGKQPNSFIIVSANPSLTSLLNSLDLELAFYHTEVDQSLYSQELQSLHQYKVELQEAKQSESVLQQFATYMAVLIGESNPLTADLLHQSANTSKIVKQLETKIAAAVITREFPLNEGPFVKELDMALQSIGVHQQQYFGGTYCCAICKLAESSLPQKSEMVATRTNISKFWGVGPNFNESKQPRFTTCIAMNSFSLQRNVTGNSATARIL
eukprot:Em0911g3a